MKKTLAALGATVLGLTAIGAASAAPATAATTPAACDSFGELSISASNPATASYFADCVPQYGVGKSEMTLSTSQDLSAFNLNNVEDAYSDLAPTAMTKYFTSGSASAVRNAKAFGGSKIASSTIAHSFGDGTSNSILGASSTGSDASLTNALKITKIEKLDKSALSSKCATSTKHYDAVYRYSYAPIDITFQTSADDNLNFAGTNGRFHIEKTVPSLTVGLNFKEGAPSDASVEDRINTGAPQCAVFNGHVLYAPKYDSNSGDSTFGYAVYSAFYGSPVFQTPLDLGTSKLQGALKIASVTGQSTASKKLTVTVKQGSVYQDGVVTVNVGGKRIKTEGQLVGGKLTLGIPSTLTGKHTVQVTFPGGPGALPTVATGYVTIQK